MQLLKQKKMCVSHVEVVQILSVLGSIMGRCIFARSAYYVRLTSPGTYYVCCLSVCLYGIFVIFSGGSGTCNFFKSPPDGGWSERATNFLEPKNYPLKVKLRLTASTFGDPFLDQFFWHFFEKNVFFEKVENT